MPFQYSCFISYRRAQYELMRTFIEELRDALRSYMEVYLPQPVYIDENLHAADFIDPALAEALCRSICMILVYTPTYFDNEHIYCTREYLAMISLEQQRLRYINSPNIRQAGLIVPIVFRGAPYVPKEIKRLRLYRDFSDFSLANPTIIRNNQFAAYLDEIAERTYEIYQELNNLPDDLCEGCSDFCLPSDDEARALLPELLTSNLPFPSF